MASWKKPRSIARAAPPNSSTLFDQLACTRLDRIGERLDVVTAGERIHHLGKSRLEAQDLLGPERQRRRLRGRQRQGLVVPVGVERLGAAQHRRQRLHRHPHDVVERLLRLEGDAAGLGVEPQPGGGVVGPEPLPRQPGPEPPGGAELGGFFEEVVVAGEEEREPGSEAVDAEAGRDRDPDVLQRIGQE